MYDNITVSSRTDRDLHKKIKKTGDYNIVPYEDSRCKITLSEVNCTDKDGKICEIEPESVIFSDRFEGNVLIGDNDNFIDKDIELILQQMCCGEKCSASLTYRDSDMKLVKKITCNIDLLEVTEEQVVSDWSWQRLHEAAMHHKEQGVLLVKQKRLPDAFRRFSKSLKFLVAMEPKSDNKEAADLRVTDFCTFLCLSLRLGYLDLQGENKAIVYYTIILSYLERVFELHQQADLLMTFSCTDKAKQNLGIFQRDSQVLMKMVKLYNNLAHIQLEYNEYSAAEDLCNRALQCDSDNIKALYRRCLARNGLHQYEDAWGDVKTILRIDPNNKAAQQKANELQPIIENINKNYSSVIKKMFNT